jgi:hypothetical protein
MIKEGECSITKQDIKEVDDRIFSFLTQKDAHKQMTQLVAFKPNHVYQKTSKLYPVLKPKEPDISGIDEETMMKLAFEHMDDKILTLAAQSC